MFLDGFNEKLHDSFGGSNRIVKSGGKIVKTYEIRVSISI
jgi:hypothetical protein